jgi:hypothetical protein
MRLHVNIPHQSHNRPFPQGFSLFTQSPHAVRHHHELIVMFHLWIHALDGDPSLGTFPRRSNSENYSRSLTWPERRTMLRSIVDAMWEEDLASSDVLMDGCNLYPPGNRDSCLCVSGNRVATIEFIDGDLLCIIRRCWIYKCLRLGVLSFPVIGLISSLRNTACE